MWRRLVGLVLGVLAVSAAGAQPPSEKPPGEKPPEKFEGEITVALSTIVVRVVDTWGRPILGLAPEDFRVRVGKTEVPVVALDWIDGGEETLPAPAAEAPATGTETVPEAAAAPPTLATLPGRLMVFFVQADLNPTRISGQMRMRPFTRELLDLLHRGDQVAVVSFDSHLKLWQDFTTDRQETQEALGVAMRYSPEVDIRLSRPYSLARHFDFAAAHRAASPEKALELTAQALEPLPGEKTLILLGWGLGRYTAEGVRMTPDYKPAVRALGRAHATVFVLDVTSADYHSLEVGLEGVAEATGGAYFKTFRQPNLATETLAQTISGYYVLTLDQAALQGLSGDVRIDLRDKRGTVLWRQVTVR
jgi:VWFA-related protein